MYDAHSMNTGSGFSLYSLVGNDKLVIQGLSPDNIAQTTVPLGVEVATAGSISVNIDHLERFDDFNIYLVDNLLGTYHDLKVAPYTVYLDAGIYEDRFKLAFSRVMNIDEQNNTFALLLSQNKGIFRLWHSGEENIQKVAVYNLSGQLIFENDIINKSEVEIDLHNIATGNLLVFKVIDDKGRTAVKKAVKR